MPTFEDTLRALHQEIRNRLILRWILANMFGWSVGLFAGMTIAQISSSVLGDFIGGFIGLLLAGAIVGGCVGFAQFKAIAIHTQWVRYSTIGGALSIFPASLMYITLIFGKLGFFMVGAVFGAGFGWLQSFTLKDNTQAATIWVIANLFAGGLCSMLSLTGMPFTLPIFCSFGPIIFGAITGYALLKLKI